MPPQLAALLCTLFILYLFWRDRKRNQDVSTALWIPLAWMFFAGSRYLSQWLELSPGNPMDAYMEGSPADRGIFLLLIVAGAIVLARRRIAWHKLLIQNWWIWLYFLFGAFSAFWSDYSLVSLRRLVKASGNVIMALIVLTEKHPYDASVVLLRRLAYFLVPLSVLFIKYYPEYGRTYSQWTFQPMFTGVALQKNGLGQICLLAGISFCWVLLMRRERQKSDGKWSTTVSIAFLFMVAWLLHKADSATSLACMVMVVGIFLVSRLRGLIWEPRAIIALGVVAVCLVGIIEVSFDLSDSVIGLLGRDPTLTSRVTMWQELQEMAGNPLVGVGFESFWLGSRLLEVWGDYRGIKQAHNGYLDVYLNLGLVGVILVVGSILSGVFKIAGHLKKDYPAAILRLSFVVTVALYNWTEATFYGASNMWLLLLLGITDVSGQEPRRGLSAWNGLIGAESKIVEVSTKQRPTGSGEASRKPWQHSGIGTLH